MFWKRLLVTKACDSWVVKVFREADLGDHEADIVNLKGAGASIAMVFRPLAHADQEGVNWII
jgi:hypothetical protein